MNTPPPLPTAKTNAAKTPWGLIGVCAIPLVILVCVMFTPGGRISLAEGVLGRGHAPALFYAALLNSTDRDTVMSGYYHLTQQRSPIAHEIAIHHLSSSDDYLWLNAAQYLGSIGEPASTPYLIKAIRHTAWRSVGDRLSYLREITGQPLDDSFDSWRAWWMTEHPDCDLDWDSLLGHAPRFSGEAPGIRSGPQR